MAAVAAAATLPHETRALTEQVRRNKGKGSGKGGKGGGGGKDGKQGGATATDKKKRNGAAGASCTKKKKGGIKGGGGGGEGPKPKMTSKNVHSRAYHSARCRALKEGRNPYQAKEGTWVCATCARLQSKHPCASTSNICRMSNA